MCVYCVCTNALHSGQQLGRIVRIVRIGTLGGQAGERWKVCWGATSLLPSSHLEPPSHSLPAGMCRPRGVPTNVPTTSPSCFYQTHAQLGKDHAGCRALPAFTKPCLAGCTMLPAFTQQKTKSQARRKKHLPSTSCLFCPPRGAT